LGGTTFGRLPNLKLDELRNNEFPASDFLNPGPKFQKRISGYGQSAIKRDEFKVDFHDPNVVAMV
jgi:hypothetical protein